MINEIVNDYVEYLKVDLRKELIPVEEIVDDMLTRLEEFESLMEMVQTNGLHSLDGSVPNILSYKDRLTALCGRVDRLETFLNHVKQDLDVVESHMETAEADVGNSDGKLKNILKPLFFKKSDPVVSSPVYEVPEIFKTSNFFPPDEDTSDS
ncbi:biogenesis of lysosome-related organelles complex 1 subunit 4 [Zootermopsis nevadensis]|uniref:Cappuccino-like protein n=1 Tax=Zootermopsis nevadensis TaxID=136037 RepID=A0A067RKL7_ZOONE|nr:biogenesis of lysosome-related organelles complex 1 subunit 4 [Zootermopsis nevadensis]KDR23558.1 Cappuccino-like protein [Zootermopsis nevadensis]